MFIIDFSNIFIYYTFELPKYEQHFSSEAEVSDFLLTYLFTVVYHLEAIDNYKMLLPNGINMADSF